MPSREIKHKADELLKKAYEENYTSVYRFCLSKLQTDRQGVEDCVQEAFIVLYKKYLADEKVEYIKAFLFQTAANFIKKKYTEAEKTKKNISLDEVINIPSQSEDIDDRLTFEEYSRQISAALSDTDAEIFSLRYIQEFKIEEVAERMNMSISAVTTRLSRLRNKLRNLLGDDFFR